MAAWSEVVAAAPELARVAEERMRSHRHALLATLRRDGSPRLSGTEVQFVLGELWMGGMGGARKARDLQRDPRLALHSAPDTPEIPTGDAKVAGRGIEVLDQATIDAWAATLGTDPPGPFHLFKVDVTEVSLLRAEGDHLVITWWREHDGLHEVERR
jgi:hypothetical protein